MSPRLDGRPRADIVKLYTGWPDQRKWIGWRQPCVLIVPAPTSVSFLILGLTTSNRHVWETWRNPGWGRAGPILPPLFS